MRGQRRPRLVHGNLLITGGKLPMTPLIVYVITPVRSNKLTRLLIDQIDISVFDLYIKYSSGYVHCKVYVLHPGKHVFHARRTIQSPITKTYLYNFDPLKSHFNIVKLGFTGVYIVFLILLKKHRLWVLVRTASPVPTSTHNLCFEQKYEKYQNFLSENFMFGGEIFYVFE